VEIAISVAIGLVTGVVVEVGVRAGWGYVKTRRVNRDYGALLNFGPDDVYFVFTKRPFEEVILPPIPTEDFLAINNMVRVLNSMGWKGRTHMRDFGTIKGDEHRNLVVVGSPRSNPFAEKVLGQLGQSCPFKFEEFPPESGRWRISCGGGVYLTSDSFRQEEDARPKGQSLGEVELDDVAVLAKFSNPYMATNKVIFIAGVRGFGTWGASYYLREFGKELYNRKSGSGGYSKNGDFVACLSVKYQGSTLQGTALRFLQDLS